jgi:hypothetical protein
VDTKEEGTLRKPWHGRAGALAELTYLHDALVLLELIIQRICLLHLTVALLACLHA